MPSATELKVRVPDRAGILGEVAGALAERNISLRAVSAWVEGDEGVIRLVAEPSVAARRELNVLGLDVEELDVVALELDDAPGALAAKATVLGAAGISITHAFVGTAGAGRAMIYLGVSDLPAALELLDQAPGAPPATPAPGAEDGARHQVPPVLNCPHHVQWVRRVPGGLHQCILCFQVVTRKDIYPRYEDLTDEFRRRWDAHEATRPAPEEPGAPAPAPAVKPSAG